MAVLMTAVEEVEVVSHFKDVLIPYMRISQIKLKPELFVEPEEDSQGALTTTLGNVLAEAVSGKSAEEVGSVMFFMLVNVYSVEKNAELLAACKPTP